MKYEASLIRNPIKMESDEWQETAHEWLVAINGQQFYYYTGIGHRKALRGREKEFNSKLGFKSLLESSKAIPPSLDDVIESIVSDAQAENESFDDWCANLGYSTDSRKALETYILCQESAKKLRKAGINIEAERERLWK